MAVDLSAVRDALNRVASEITRALRAIDDDENAQAAAARAFDAAPGTGTPALTQNEIAGTSASDPGTSPSPSSAAGPSSKPTGGKSG